MADLFISTACVPVVGATQAQYNAAKEWAAELFNTPIEDLDERLDEAGVLHGTTAQVAETLSAWAEIGIRRYYIQRPGRDQTEREGLCDVLEAALG